MFNEVSKSKGWKGKSMYDKQPMQDATFNDKQSFSNARLVPNGVNNSTND